MIGRADIEGSKSDVAMNAWPPQASYPCGNFSDTSCFKLRMAKRIDRPRFRGPYSYWKSGSSRHLPFCSTGGFCPPWAGLRTPALSFDRCTAPVKLPIWQCPQPGSSHGISSEGWRERSNRRPLHRLAPTQQTTAVHPRTQPTAHSSTQESSSEVHFAGSKPDETTPGLLRFTE